MGATTEEGSEALTLGGFEEMLDEGYPWSTSCSLAAHEVIGKRRALISPGTSRTPSPGYAAFPDLRFEVRHMLAAGDMVAEYETNGVTRTRGSPPLRRKENGKADHDQKEAIMSIQSDVQGHSQRSTAGPEHFETMIVGGGQAGLSVGYHLAKRGRPFVILEANERIGDSWRKRWDSLRLFTPARYDGLAGWLFPAPGWSFPTKDEMADYLEAYAAHFELPVRTGIRVERLSRDGRQFVVAAGGKLYEAENVVVAMANFQRPQAPAFAGDLDPGIVQLHSYDYRNPSQLREGGVLIVGAGNSGAEIALEVSRTHSTWLSGRDTGHMPFRIEGPASRLLLAPLVLRFVFHRVLSMNTPIGRRVRPKILSNGAPLIRIKPGELIAAGVERVPRVVGVRDGSPLLEDGRVLDVANVVWCTGFHPGFSWIDLPVFEAEEPVHERGVVGSEPGLYFVGLEFLYAMSSVMIHGLDRDAEHIAGHISSRRGARPVRAEPRTGHTEETEGGTGEMGEWRRKYQQIVLRRPKTPGFWGMRLAFRRP